MEERWRGCRSGNTDPRKMLPFDPTMHPTCNFLTGAETSVEPQDTIIDALPGRLGREVGLCLLHTAAVTRHVGVEGIRDLLDVPRPGLDGKCTQLLSLAHRPHINLRSFPTPSPLTPSPGEEIDRSTPSLYTSRIHAHGSLSNFSLLACGSFFILGEREVFFCLCLTLNYVG